ncbi:MAG: hypothetical protein A2268_12540 [Candidatus Raymondbacteria bacterium RifOxyA12_full_50_37]|uniref:Uroporphyrinogen decarboxylase (URO-D) domain-containing protein n=1 Tax=Candidatus Raymondbacteria bacterium RIFOXYD12_FULL_49_13 TaxID=1817890 RepID=A0A1F7FA82_UNCRA|nr:MAG: hypothetical protein A2268_12540 [Candidatus Raymondbacteria bacterium RifOxyA12_full_50_37]OGJ91004.1 MAG: hypothetical protein A2248_00560 [Candidatus Raymondbacteria bacterium RIFOXYA2_FULL_49_16]OGJ97441.1 MAG: hypothetical protein A2453_10110 [Candidatus Raymondbacteria bacterium RIFOXYC2_FULL_50_21]OGK01760.1 MAG: hypothetical protein A2350_17560 [Candidatus Raymondbacteria bacterium RifOxyB12_full_50_8]OGK03589.1 MAG: hypothetical protein A2519_11785 [Candidatus Raymondbacteria b
MTSKQRVLDTVEGRIPDRVPIGEFAIDSDTVEKIIGHETYLRAKAKSQIAFWEGRHDEVAESWRKDHIELFRKLELDIITFPMYTWDVPRPSDDPPPRKVDAATWEDTHGRVFKFSEATADITCVSDPVMDRKVFAKEEFEKEPDPSAPDKRSRAILDSVITVFKNEKFIIGPSGGEVGIVLLGGMERGMEELLTNPEAVSAATAYYLKKQTAADPLCIHPDSDAIMWGQDFCFNSGPFIDPEMFRQLFFAANKERVDTIHRKHGKKVFKHCCGNTQILLDMFVDMGYDVYQSIQPTAGMDVCAVKRSHGHKIGLWGGVALEHLIGGTMDDVRTDVRRAMQCAKEGGRFILGASHSIAVGAKYDNYMAMIDEYWKHCSY